MKTFKLCLIALVAAAPVHPAETETNATPPAAPAAEVRSPSAALSASSRFIYGTPGELYPVFGGVPKVFWPYSNIEPYQRYFVTRMPFRGPGRDYPPPTDLKSLRIGLIDSPKVGANWGRSERTRAGIVQAIEEANRERQPGELPFELVEHVGFAQWGGAANLAALLADAVDRCRGQMEGAQRFAADHAVEARDRLRVQHRSRDFG